MRIQIPNKRGGLVTSRDLSNVIDALEASVPRGLAHKTTRGVIARKERRLSAASSIPRGTVVMVHLFPTESITDFFDTGTGLGTGRWAGWALCDGQNDGPDMLGFFPVCADLSNDDYDIQGHGENTNAQTGFKWHGLTENNHQDHALNHWHPCISLSITTPTQCAQSGVDVYAWDSPPTFGLTNPCTDANNSWIGSTSLPDYETPVTVDSIQGRARHRGPYNSNSDTDNRPPNYVIHFAVKL